MKILLSLTPETRKQLAQWVREDAIENNISQEEAVQNVIEALLQDPDFIDQIKEQLEEEILYSNQ